MRDHSPIVIEEFNGLWKRGDPDDPSSSVDSCPIDHFSDCNNIQFIQSGFKTRYGIDTYLPYANVLRIFTFTQQTGESLLILTTGGTLFHSSSPTPFSPILTIAEMIDFGVVSIAGRAYITPCNSVTGIANEFVYVYLGDGTTARKAAGFPPVSPDTGFASKQLTAYNNEVDGDITKGIHVFAVAFGNAGGDISILGPGVILPSVQRAFPIIDAPGGKEATLVNLPLTLEAGVDKWIIAATKTIDPKDFNPDPTTHTYYKVAEYTYDTTQTVISGSFKDTDLTVDLTSHLTAASGSTPPSPPVSTCFMAVNSDVNGGLDVGFRLIGVVYETNTGFLTAPGPEGFASVTTTIVSKKINLVNIPISPDPFVVKRRLVASKIIENYNGDQTGYQLFFIPDAIIDDNTTTYLLGISFFDADLLNDATHLLDNFSEIPAQLGLNTYHGRLVGWAESENTSVIRLSAQGEPEAISQVDGLVIVPLDGKPLTYVQEFRDTLYAFKATRTNAYNDNSDAPASWLLTVLDQGTGCSVHGIASVLDSGGVNIDYLIVADYSGIMLFNGSFVRPELTWKIRDLWLSLKPEDFLNLQILNDTLEQVIYVTFPGKRIISGNYANGLTPQDIRWSVWTFDVETTTISLVETNKLVIGAKVAPMLRVNSFRYVGSINCRSTISAVLATTSKVSTFTYAGSIAATAGFGFTYLGRTVSIFSFFGIINAQSEISNLSSLVVATSYLGLIPAVSGIASDTSFVNPHVNAYLGSIAASSGIAGTLAHSRVYVYAGSI